MKLFTVCLLCTVLSLSIFVHSTYGASLTQQTEDVEHPVSLSVPETEEPSSLLTSLLRTKRHSHLSLCSYCCKCCHNKGCGFCCLT